MNRTRQFLLSDRAVLLYLALVTLIVHLVTSVGYGYFGDEFYWQAMTRHLDFGYVDVPPLAAYLGAISLLLVGPSMFAIHILPALAGAVMVYFAGRRLRHPHPGCQKAAGQFPANVEASQVLHVRDETP